MFTAEDTTHFVRHSHKQNFMLLVENHNQYSEFTCFPLNHDNQPSETPYSISTDALMDMVTLPTTSNTQAELTDERVFLDNAQYLGWTYQTTDKTKLFYSHETKVIANSFPFPPLIFLLHKTKRTLSIYATQHKTRPKMTTRLYCAPLPNINNFGHVCLGSLVLPKENNIDAISEAYFQSTKTHLNNKDLFRGKSVTNQEYYNWALEVIKTKRKVSVKELAPSQQSTIEKLLKTL
ncbi:hypothetical protein [Vibrio barjaei]|uniref:hypothetical protein n=1 Tax=Vibrio barjaei TaxID=1676683 RepID=UPI0022848694|nr:hypothetical protein [Vibrio barjaei]MCY9870508.1 hypothetical protein [Vibrio barjaei]